MMGTGDSTSRARLPELLAPAGGFEQLRYAILFGADAVYLATDRFGLRQRADNFTLDEVPRAVELAHAANIKVYVACNAYMHDEDRAVLPEYLLSLAEAGIDALIVSDLGVLRMARRLVPELSLHISTQASTSNTEAALAWHELGASRIVCAREMSLREIETMRKALPDELELEVFVHGAMCMAVSGRCLISDYLTGRSANRGHCTQPCRWGYTLEEPTRPGQPFPLEEDGRHTFIMNSKDLCMLGHLQDLIDAGVDSLKIEGRNKKAFYVATIVNAYRQVLDGVDPALMLPELETVSHRPYSTGFFYGPAEQAPDQEAYMQRYDWAAEVETVLHEDVSSCRQASGTWATEPEGSTASSSDKRVRVLCRNRFYEGDVLEVLSPNRSVAAITVRDLRREYAGGGAEPAGVANQAMEAYSFLADGELHPRDILRVKRIDPNQKN